MMKLSDLFLMFNLWLHMTDHGLVPPCHRRAGERIGDEIGVPYPSPDDGNARMDWSARAWAKLVDLRNDAMEAMSDTLDS